MTKASKPDKRREGTDVLPLTAKRGESEADTLARCALLPSVRAAITARTFAKSVAGDSIELRAMVAALSDQTAAVRGGDLARVEDMLTAHAHTLDAIFNELAQRAIAQEYMQNLDTFMRLALKAQSQCRATLEALAEIKNPRPVAFVHQANIAQGPQQVNNGQASRAEKTPTAPNGLLETPHERMDVRPQIEPGRADPALEAVGAVNRATYD